MIEEKGFSLSDLHSFCHLIEKCLSYLFQTDAEKGDAASDVGDIEEYYAKMGREGTGGFDEEDEEMEEWDEGNKLYEWTQELNFNDDLIQTPLAVQKLH